VSLSSLKDDDFPFRKVVEGDSEVLLLAALAAGATVNAPPGALSALLAEEVSKASRGHAPLSDFDLSTSRGAFETSLKTALGHAMFKPRAAASVAITQPAPWSEVTCEAGRGLHVSVRLTDFRVPDDGLWCLRINDVEVACFGDATFSVLAQLPHCSGTLQLCAVLRGGDLESPEVIRKSDVVHVNVVGI